MPDPEPAESPEPQFYLTLAGREVAKICAGVDSLARLLADEMRGRLRAERKLSQAREAFTALPQEVQFKLAELCRNQLGGCWCGSHVAELQGSLNEAATR